jgi:hypothetical protein
MTGRALPIAMTVLIALVSTVCIMLTQNPQQPVPPAHAWLLGQEPTERFVKDQAGDWTATVQGSPAVSKNPQALQFRGGADALVIGARQARIKGKEITLAAWVRIDAGARKGGIIGQIQDNLYAGKGASLGYDSLGFRFGLAAQSTGQADGTMTWIRSSAGLNPGKWTHVAATYDGVTMKLFVDGILEGSSQSQSGAIIPADAPLTIGGYIDADERVPFVGAIHSAGIYEKALSGEALLAMVESGKVCCGSLLAIPHHQFHQYRLGNKCARCRPRGIWPCNTTWEQSDHTRRHHAYGNTW